ncbi:MAG TPA: hypothetical protein VLX28_03270, partial [Thermoanaerobaculia bacterium]|nr:hypothetical protein [Thermoanaerobaculia bacterium]
YAGIGGEVQPPLAEPADAIFGRLQKQFATVLPLTGLPAEPPQLSLWRWTPQGTVKVDDPNLVQRLARQLKNAWLAANGNEIVPGSSIGKQPKLTPKQEEELRSLGYVTGGKR